MSSIGKKIFVGGIVTALVAGGGFVISQWCGDNIARWYVNKKIGSEKTYTDVMDSVSPLTKMDELLKPANYEAIDAAYRDARLQGNYDVARYDLATLYDFTLKAAICNYEGIEIADLQKYEVWIEADKSDAGKTGLTAKCAIEYEKKVSEQTAGNVINNKIVKVTTSYELGGHLYDMAYNYILLKNNYPFENKEVSADEAFVLSNTDDISRKFSDLDSDYLALERFLLTEDVELSFFNNTKLTTDFEVKKVRTL